MDLKFMNLKNVFGVIKIFKNFGVYSLDYLGFYQSQMITYHLRSGVNYVVRAGSCDRSIINEIWLDECYTPKGFEIKNTDTVFDIGAQIGVFSVYAASFAKKGTVYSFEPMTDNFKILKENIHLNKMKNIVPINKGVSDSMGKQDLFICSNNTGGHSFFDSWKNSKKIVIKTISLNAVIKQYDINVIDFLKMDCEGAEYRIFFGASSSTLKKIKKISMEYHNLDKDNNVHKLKTFLEKKGFIVKVLAKPYQLLFAYRK